MKDGMVRALSWITPDILATSKYSVQSTMYRVCTMYSVLCNVYCVVFYVQSDIIIANTS